jgi:hypothetical protein
MKRMMVFGLLIGLMLFGCVIPPAPEGNESAKNVTLANISNAPEPGDTFAVKAVNGKFTITDYNFSDNSNPFSDGAGGDLGKKSAAFIKIDENNLTFLSSDCKNEKQAFWIHPMIKGEGGGRNGVIFNAVYTADFNGTCPQIRFLGKDYTLIMFDASQSDSSRIVRGGNIELREIGSGKIIALKDGSSFNNDDRWKVVLGWKSGRLTKIVIYMEGYFYEIKEDEEIPLFGTDKVIAKFENLGTEPTFKLTTAESIRTGEGNSAVSGNAKIETAKPQLPIIKSFIVHDDYAALNYTGEEIVNESGIYIKFQEPLKVCTAVYTEETTDCYGACYCDNDYATETHEVSMPILDTDYKIGCLKFDKTTNTSKLCLIRVEHHEPWIQISCESSVDPFDENTSDSKNYIDAFGRRYTFYDLDTLEDNRRVAVMCELSDNNTCKERITIPCGEELVFPDGGGLHLWRCVRAYAFCTSWVSISYFSDEIVLENGNDGVELEWAQKTLGRETEIIEVVNGSVRHRLGREEVNTPGLKSVFIPSGSYTYKKLIG